MAEYEITRCVAARFGDVECECPVHREPEPQHTEDPSEPEFVQLADGDWMPNPICGPEDRA